MTINVHKQRYVNCNAYVKKQNVTKRLKQLELTVSDTEMT